MISIGKTVEEGTDFGKQSSYGGHTGSGLEKQVTLVFFGSCLQIWSRDELKKLLLKEVEE